MTTPAPFLSRHLGDYLLVAQLSEDVLGTVFRALYAADERRFVRLRILQSSELSREAIEHAVRKNAFAGAMIHDAIVPRALLDEVEGVPFLTWDETAGWTLDTMLARVRAYGIRIPAEYALLIAERIADALEHAHQTSIEGRPADHGLLWPGFVSISHDAAVRIGGFGVADGVLPVKLSARLAVEIGPYLAPEVRNGGPIRANSDVYSLGSILIELLTGRRPSLETPSVELRAGDPRSEELEAFLKKCLAPPETRFESAVEAHRALQQLLTGNPFSLYTANLALFLYKLLNPESQIVAASSDFESTNPVAIHGVPAPAPDEIPPPLPLPGTPRRRRGDVAFEEEEEEEEEEAPMASEALLSPPAVRDAATAAPAAARTPETPEAPGTVIPDLAEIRRRTLPPLPAMARAWVRPFATLAAAAGLAVGAFFVASQFPSARRPARAQATAIEAPAPVSAPAPAPAIETAAPGEAAAPATGPAPAPPPVLPAVNRPPARSAKKIHPELRQPAEDLRLKAALARIEAERVNARDIAGAVFGEGRTSEQEGERLMRDRDYAAAQVAFGRAARLFERAHELTWQERVRRADLAQVNTLPGEPSAR